MTLEIGQVVPDVKVYKLDGTTIEMQTYWATRPVVLTFLRHFGCQFCREFLGTLRLAYPEFVSRGVALVAVAQGMPHQTAHFVQTLQLPFPMLADPTRSAFRAFGLGDGTLSTLLAPAVLGRMLNLAAQGQFPGVSDHVQAATGSNGSSLRQLSGTFVIEPGGVLRYIHVATPIYQRPSIMELLAALPEGATAPLALPQG